MYQNVENIIKKSIPIIQLIEIWLTRSGKELLFTTNKHVIKAYGVSNTDRAFNNKAKHVKCSLLVQTAPSVWIAPNTCLHFNGFTNHKNWMNTDNMPHKTK